MEVEQCYNITRTLCSEEEELVDREVCQFSQEEGRQEVRGRECSSQQVTVCQPAQYGHGYPAGR